MLILDEPTSGVDPVARDAFWQTLIDLSRNNGVTIFISTHFMNEADRCDRISLMHAGKLLAVGTPQELVQKRGSASLEDAFISYLAEAAGIKLGQKAPPTVQNSGLPNQNRRRPRPRPCAAHVASTLAGYGPTRGVRPWSCCAIRSGWRLPSSDHSS